MDKNMREPGDGCQFQIISEEVDDLLSDSEDGCFLRDDACSSRVKLTKS